MLKNKRCRHMLTAFGGVLILAGANTAAIAQGTQFRAALTGAGAVPAGDPDGSGVAEIRVLGGLNQVCVQLEVSGISRATQAHIHRGAAGTSGTAVVNLDPPDADQDENDCDRVGDGLADDIQRNPGGFYVDVHTADHPEGAIRGQITPSAD